MGRGVDVEAAGADRLQPGLAPVTQSSSPNCSTVALPLPRSAKAARSSATARGRNRRGAASRRAAPGRVRRRPAPAACHRSRTVDRRRAALRPGRGCRSRSRASSFGARPPWPAARRAAWSVWRHSRGSHWDSRAGRGRRAVRASRWPRDAGSAGYRNQARDLAMLARNAASAAGWSVKR